MTTQWLDNEIRIAEAHILRAEDTLRNAPAGPVRLRSAQGRDWIAVGEGSFKDGTRTERYVSPRNPLAEQYIDKYYAAKALPLLRRELSALQTFRDTYHPDDKYQIIKQVPSSFVSRIDPGLRLKTIAERNAEWESARFDRNPYPFPENTEYVTEKGERVRSRAEYIIASILHQLRIPYRYECALSINGTTVYPDFTIRHPENGETFYLEYFGMMNDPDYAAKAFNRIQLFQKSEYAARFHCFFESDFTPLNTAVIRNLFQRVFLSR